MTEEFQYKPGECNIDDVGVRYRKNLAYLAGAGAIVVFVLIYYFRLHPAMRFFIMALFGYAISVNIVQVRERFCVANATKGTIEINRKMLPIADKLHTRLDREKRDRILRRTTLISVLSGLAGLLPL